MSPSRAEKTLSAEELSEPNTGTANPFHARTVTEPKGGHPVLTSRSFKRDLIERGIAVNHATNLNKWASLRVLRNGS